MIQFVLKAIYGCVSYCVIRKLIPFVNNSVRKTVYQYLVETWPVCTLEVILEIN